jgi:hypothetical protein
MRIYILYAYTCIYTYTYTYKHTSRGALPQRLAHECMHVRKYVCVYVIESVYIAVRKYVCVYEIESLYIAHKCVRSYLYYA